MLSPPSAELEFEFSIWLPPGVAEHTCRGQFQSRFTPSRAGQMGQAHGPATWAVGYRLFSKVITQDCFLIASSMTAVSTNLCLWPMWSCIIYTYYAPCGPAIQESHVDPRVSWTIYTFWTPCEHQRSLSSKAILSCVQEGFFYCILCHVQASIDLN